MSSRMYRFGYSDREHSGRLVFELDSIELVATVRLVPGAREQLVLIVTTLEQAKRMALAQIAEMDRVLKGNNQ